MPNITSGNTNAPTQALARYGSVMLVEDLNQGTSPVSVQTLQPGAEIVARG